MKNSSNEQYIYSFELLFISTTHVEPRAVVQMNNSSNGSSSNEIASGMTMDGPIFSFLIITNFIQCNKTAFLFKF